MVLKMKLVSPAGSLCEGDNTPPSLRWSGPPEGTRSFAVILDDPDAPAGTFTHWLLWNIPADVHSLRTGYTASGAVRTGTNDFGKAAYGGPCPPKGHGPHRYYFSLYALDVGSLDVPDGATRAELEPHLDRHAIGTVKCLGRYERK